MNLIQRIEAIEKDVELLMNKNQSIKDKQSKINLGFNILCDLRDEVKWLKQDLEKSNLW